MSDLAKYLAGQGNIQNNLQTSTVKKSLVSSSVVLSSGNVKNEDMPKVIEQATISNAFILGHSTFGVLGTSVLGGTLSYAVKRIANPNNTWKTRLTSKEVEFWKDTTNSTATWNTSTKLITFTADQIAQTNSIALPGWNIVSATPMITIDSGDIDIYLSRDGGNTWVTATNETENLFLTSGIDYTTLSLGDETAWYKLDDDAASTTVIDSSGNSNDGTASENTNNLSNTGKVGNAFSFNGIDQEVSLFNLSSMPIDFSIAFWAKTDGTDSGNASAIFFGGRFGDPTGHGFRFERNTASGTSMTIYIRTTDTNDVSIGTTITSDWAHYILTKVGTTMTVYKNNGLVNAKTLTQSEYRRSTTMVLGNNFNWFNGSMDDVRIYDRGITSAERALLSQISPSSPSGQDLRLRLDEGASSTAQVSYAQVAYTQI